MEPSQASSSHPSTHAHVAQGEASRTADYREGIGAFQEKRTAEFTGR